MHIDDLEYFSPMRTLIESENISDCDLEVHINRLVKLREDFKILFGDLDNMNISKWLVTPIDMRIDNKGDESDLDDELILIVGP